MGIERTIEQLRQHGWAKAELDAADVAGNCSRLEELLDELGTPLHVFRRFPFWKPIGTDLDRPLGKSGGTGLNSLHTDCVNMAQPPDYVVLLCVRADPAGGGGSLVSSTDGLARRLTPQTLDTLAEIQLSEGYGVDLDGVGGTLERFRVFDENGYCRYTGRSLEDATPGSAAFHALLELDRVLMEGSERTMLEDGEAMVIDQRRCLHGRLPLGPGQELVPDEARRLVVQAFGRAARLTQAAASRSTAEPALA
jgi:hypothetical protein